MLIELFVAELMKRALELLSHNIRISTFGLTRVCWAQLVSEELLAALIALLCEALFAANSSFAHETSKKLAIKKTNFFITFTLFSDLLVTVIFRLIDISADFLSRRLEHCEIYLSLLVE